MLKKTNQPLLYRVTKIRWEPANRWRKRECDGDFWQIVKYEVDYRTRKNDITNARNYAIRYSNGHWHYTVRVEVAPMPTFTELES